MRDFSLIVRRIDPEDVRQCEGVPDYLEHSEDGGAALVVNGELVAVTDEYGTAYLRPGTTATPRKDQVEAFLNVAADFYAEVAL